MISARSVGDFAKLSTRYPIVSACFPLITPGPDSATGQPPLLIDFEASGTVSG
jgi:hypothetical protein